jgi:beta-N-acetylhexosaminidase
VDARTLARALLGCVLPLAMACSACSAAAGGGPAGTAPGTPPPAAASRQAAAPGQAAPSCPQRVLSRMTMAQRVGQLFLVGIAGDPGREVAGAVAAYHFGALLFATTSTAGAARVRQLTGAVQALATAGATAGARFFVAANQEGGEVQQLRGAGFATMPPALAQGALPAAVLQRQAAAWGRQLSRAGVNLNLAPVMDVVPAGPARQNQPIGVLHREFGDNPATVADHGVAFIRGMRQAGVATTAKHFPGLGRVRGNTDFTSGVTDTVTGPGDPYLRGYRAAIGAGVPFVMVALATYTRIDPRHLAVFSSRVMRVMLRDQMGFRGVIVSDDLGAAAAVAAVPPADRAIGFLAAGGDMITSASLPAAAAMAAAVLARAAADPGFRSVVDAAAMHVLAAKQAYGLLPCRGS